MKRRRTTIGTLIDHDKAWAYDRIKMLYVNRWLERYPFLKWAIETWIDKPWRR